MKKLAIFSVLCVLILCTVFCLSACSSSEEEPSVSPSPSPDAEIEEVHIDSPIVGQWVPVGVDGQGYMSFLEDGTIVRFELRNNDSPLIQEQHYKLTGENTFCMVYKNGDVSNDYEFEIINDGKTLNIYDTSSGLRIPSEFYRIEEDE